MKPKNNQYLISSLEYLKLFPDSERRAEIQKLYQDKISEISNKIKNLNNEIRQLENRKSSLIKRYRETLR